MVERRLDLDVLPGHLLPDGVGVAPLALAATLPEPGLEHAGRRLEVVVANLEKEGY